MNKQVKKPNVVRGGIAIPLGRNYYYMAGRKHKNGGIDIGKNPRTGLEVEDGEVMHISDKNVKVFSSVPFLNGKSPAQKVLGGDNPNAVFKQQESFKDRNGINDDGTKKKAFFGINETEGLIDKVKNISQDDIDKINNSWLATGVKLFDPTGITSWYDVKRAIDDYKENPKNPMNSINLTTEIIGAIPVIGKAAKGVKAMKAVKKAVKGKPLTDAEKALVDYAKKHRRQVAKNSAMSDAKDVVGGGKDIYDSASKNMRKYGGKCNMGGLSRSKDYGSKSKSYSKEGGIYSITANGKTKMRMLSSTGGRTKAPFGIDYKLPDIIGINPNENDKYVETMLKPINKLVSNTQQYYNAKQNNYTTTKKRNLFSNTKNPFKMTKGDTISLASNIGGSLISAGINALALKNLKSPSRPISAPAAKLKTHININPQLDRMRETIAEYERNVDNNTLSSRVALARKQNARLNSILQTNELYGAKENAETELINKDKINRQTVAAENIKAYNDWRDRVNTFENEIVDKKSENLVSMIGNINQGLQDVVSRNEQRDSERQTRLAMLAAYPNVNPRILRTIGVKGITDADVANWEKIYYSKKNKQLSDRLNETLNKKFTFKPATDIVTFESFNR